MPFIFVLTVLFVPVVLSDPRCWSEHVREDVCCDPAMGPRGVETCWDEYYTFEWCCDTEEWRSKTKLANVAAEARKLFKVMPPWRPPTEVKIVWVGVFFDLISKRDCWEGGVFTPEYCCDVAAGRPFGQPLCWDTTIKFVRCCVGIEPGLDAGLDPPKPLSTPTVKLDRSLYPVGDECWADEFSWGLCCASDKDTMEQCWDAYRTSDRCCQEMPDFSSQPMAVQMSSPVARCLTEMQGRLITTMANPNMCEGGVYFYLNFVERQTVENPKWNNLPWWAHPRSYFRTESAEDKFDFQKGRRPTRPVMGDFVGGICLPTLCNVSIAGQWLVPRLSPWWIHPEIQVYRHNSTHVLIPPPVAMPVKYEYFHTSFVTPRPSWANKELPPILEIAMSEHRSTIELGNPLRNTLLTLLFLSLLAGYKHLLGSRSFFTTAFAPQLTLRRLCQPKLCGTPDLVRIALTLCVLSRHSFAHVGWAASETNSSFSILKKFVQNGANRVNVGFVVLMVDLSMVHGRGFWNTLDFKGRAKQLVSRVFSRWVGLATLSSFWTCVFLACDGPIPINTLSRSRGMFTWFGTNKDVCQDPAHIVPGALLFHEVIFGYSSPCGNANILEALLQIYTIAAFVVTFAGTPRRSLLAASLLWPPSVACSWFKWNLVKHPSVQFKGPNIHYWWMLLPACMSTVLISSALPSGAEFAQRLVGKPLLRAALWCISVTLVAASVTHHALLYDEDYVTGYGAKVKAFYGYTGSPWHIIQCQPIDLIFVFALVLILRLGSPGNLSRTTVCCSTGTGNCSLLVVASRLCAGVNASNLFVYHFISGFCSDETIEPTIPAYIGFTLNVALYSVIFSLVYFVLAEGPSGWLVAGIAKKIHGTSASEF